MLRRLKIKLRYLLWGLFAVVLSSQIYGACVAIESARMFYLESIAWIIAVGIGAEVGYRSGSTSGRRGWRTLTGAVIGLVVGLTGTFVFAVLKHFVLVESRQGSRMPIIATAPETHDAHEVLALLLRIAQHPGYYGRVGITVHVKNGDVVQVD